MLFIITVREINSSLPPGEGGINRPSSAGRNYDEPTHEGDY